MFPTLGLKGTLLEKFKALKSAGFEGVELRTTHKHGVEPRLTKDERKEVKQRFADAGVEIWGCGTICEFHSPDPAVVKNSSTVRPAFAISVRNVRCGSAVHAS